MSSPPKRARARLLLVALAATGLVLIAALVTLRVSAAARHGAARSMRAVLGPPAPAALTSEELDALAEPGEAREPVLIPHAPADPLPPLPTPRRPPDLRGVSFVLLLGADNRTDAVVGRTDAMIVAAFRHRDGRVAAFSVPRDLWVPLPDVGSLHEQGRDHARVSSIVRVGEARVGLGEGIPLLRRTLHEQLGIRVDRHAVIDLRGFEALVDALDGVEVDVECPIEDCFWIDGVDQPCAMMTVEAGRQRMDGATALAFVRSRHGTGDRDRTRRQQAVLLGLARELRGAGLRGLPGLWRKAAPFVTTDLEARDALYYGSYALDAPLDQIRGFAIRHPMTSRHVTADNKHVLLLDREQFDRALEGMFGAELPALRARKRCPDPDAALRG